MSQTFDDELELLGDHTTFTMQECCITTQSSEGFIIELITESIITPLQDNNDYRFTLAHVQTIRTARSFHQDLGVNTPGIALALELLDRIRLLERN